MIRVTKIDNTTSSSAARAVIVSLNEHAVPESVILQNGQQEEWPACDILSLDIDTATGGLPFRLEIRRLEPRWL